MQRINLSRRVEIDGEPEPGRARIVCEAHGGWSKGWCALLLPGERTPDERWPGRYLYDLDRRWLDSEDDLSRAGNGRRTYDELGPGIYEADSVWRSYASRRHLIRVRPDGTATVLQSDDRPGPAWRARASAAIALALVEDGEALPPVVLRAANHCWGEPWESVIGPDGEPVPAEAFAGRLLRVWSGELVTHGLSDGPTDDGADVPVVTTVPPRVWHDGRLVVVRRP